MAATARDIRTNLQELLHGSDWSRALRALAGFPTGALAKMLPAFLCNADSKIRWRAVDAMGSALVRLADEDMEAARRVMRRLLWSLNDESGGIGWGAAEAMGEAVARHPHIAGEFAPILMALLREDGYHLQYAPLPMQRAALWAVCRAASAWPHLLADQAGHLLEYLDSPDPASRTLAARALGLLKYSHAESQLEALCVDTAHAVLEQPDGPEPTTVGAEAQNALKIIKDSQ